MIEAARASGADAVHPGYGFLSENADFAQACRDAGLVFVGPSPEAIRRAGHKAAAKALRRRAACPACRATSGDDQDNDEAAGAEAAAHRLPADDQGQRPAAAGAACGAATTRRDAAAALLQSARAEALASFGNGDLLLERRCGRPRHVEVQVFADTHGHCGAPGRARLLGAAAHQKIIEEAPSPAVDAALRERMGAAAWPAQRGIGYVGRARWNSCSTPADDFFFLEMNTRLQVEHPVTEAITGLDLVDWQLRVARG
jgi:geranyl-CoA carboxylase alpha subunit